MKSRLSEEETRTIEEMDETQYDILLELIASIKLQRNCQDARIAV